MRILGLSVMAGVAFASADSAMTLKVYNDKKKSYEVVSTVEFADVRISKSCKKSGKMNCQAWSAVESRRPLTGPAGVGVVGNPAARYCLDHKASNRILLDEKKREYDYCVFADGSMVDAWSLYNKHYGK